MQNGYVQWDLLPQNIMMQPVFPVYFFEQRGRLRGCLVRAEGFGALVETSWLELANFVLLTFCLYLSLTRHF